MSSIILIVFSLALVAGFFTADRIAKGTLWLIMGTLFFAGLYILMLLALVWAGCAYVLRGL